jgi:hypothetical protein
MTLVTQELIAPGRLLALSLEELTQLLRHTRRPARRRASPSVAAERPH